MPEEYRGWLAHQRGRSAGIDLSPLPEAIRRELAWCEFRIIAQGAKVDVTHMRARIRRLGEVISDLGPAAPASLTGLVPRDWQQQFALAVRRRTGTLPAPDSVSDVRSRSACTSLAATRPASARSRPAGCASASNGTASNGTAKWGWKPGRWRGEQSDCGSPRPPSLTPSCTAGACPARGWPEIHQPG